MKFDEIISEELKSKVRVFSEAVLCFGGKCLGDQRKLSSTWWNRRRTHGICSENLCSTYNCPDPPRNSKNACTRRRAAVSVEKQNHLCVDAQRHSLVPESQQSKVVRKKNATRVAEDKWNFEENKKCKNSERVNIICSSTHLHYEKVCSNVKEVD